MSKQEKGNISQKIHRYKPIRLKREAQLSDAEFKRTASRMLYWSTVLFLTFMNFMIAIVLIPFLISAPTPQLYITVVFFGLLFGHIFNLLITKIEYLERHHHIFAAAFIPLITFITLFTILSSVQSIAATLNLTIKQDSQITALLYAASFIAPYILIRLTKISH